MVIASIALFVALDGPATAARLIDGGTIKRNSITSAQIKNGTIGSADIKDHALGVRDLSGTLLRRLETTPAKSVTTGQLATHAVSADKIVDGAVGSAALANGSVLTQHLADGAVGMSQLAAGAVTPSKIADGAVGTAAVADGSLQTHDVGDFAGSVSIDFDPFKGQDCQVAKDIAPQPTAPGSGAVISDDVVAVSPAAGWPDLILVQANPGANNTLRIVACRIGGDPSPAASADDIDPPATVFQYVAIDQP